MAALNLAGKTSGYIKLKSPDVALNATVELPNKDGILATLDDVGSGGGTSLPDQTGQDGKYLQTDGTNATWQEVASTSHSPAFKNLLINGDMSVNQRQYSRNGVNEYTLDRWYAWGYGTGTSQGTTNGTKYFLRQSRVDGPWSGILQTVETKNMIHAIGHRLTLSFKLRVGSAFDGSINFAVRERTDAEGHVVAGANTNLMGSGSYALNSTNTSSDWQTYSMICDLPVSANAKAVGITSQHTSSVVDANNFYDITDVQLEISDGNNATDFEHLPYDVNLSRCHRYYQKSYSYETVVGTVTNMGRFNAGGDNGSGATTGLIGGPYVRYRAAMRTNPTVTLYDDQGNVNKCIRFTLGASNNSNEEVTLADNNNEGFWTYSPTGVNNSGMGIHYQSDAEIY